ncbi:SPFH domain-containing protein [Methanomethylophilus alvi]|uniref:SPFH domain-containing protein n=1 Tax=Methanomethylophilus alvi TaxID=1291540 RepID=UPI0037DCF383
MALFKKNPNETLYPTGEKTFITVIKNESAPGNIVWKVPYEDFNTHSKLIVGENEEALFIKNGEILESFTGGEYTLDTNNYPFLSRIRNALSGGISVYNCKVVYIMKAHNLDNRWGTDGAGIQVVDKVYGIATSLMARGAYTVAIEDGKQFYLKFVKSNTDSLSTQDFVRQMRAPINQKIKSLIGKVVREMPGEIIGICEQQDEIAENMTADLEASFDEYGVRLVNFYVEAIEVADSKTREQLEQARANRITTVIEAQGEKARLDTLGITWAQAESASIMHDAAKNEGNATMSAGMGLGMGVGMGAGMGTAFGNMATNTLVPLNQQGQQPGTPQITPPQPNPQQTYPGAAPGAAPGQDGRFAVKEQPAPTGTPAGEEFIQCSCGFSVKKGSKFCPECGKPLIAVCPQCGNQIQPGAKFCPECGGKLI